MVVTKVQRAQPPAELLAECPVEDVALTDNASLALSRQAYKRALESCNADKSALRQWVAKE